MKEFDCELYRQKRREEFLKDLDRLRLSNNRRRWKDTSIGHEIFYDVKWTPPNYNYRVVPHIPHPDNINTEYLRQHWVESLECTTCEICRCEFEYKRHGYTNQCKRSEKFGDVLFVLEVDDPPRLCPECNKVFNKQYNKLKLPEKCNGTPGRERKAFIKNKYRDLLDAMTIKIKIKTYEKQD